MIKISWTCMGVAFSGTVGPFRKAMAAISKAYPSLAPPGHPELAGMALVTERLGEIVENFYVELRAQKEQCEVDIEGHYLYHSCGRFYNSREWAKLPLSKTKRTSLLTAEEVLVPARRCECGEHVTYSSLSIRHAQDMVQEMCTSNGGLA